MKTITDADALELIKLLSMVTRLQPGSLPSAMDQATASAIHDRLSKTPTADDVTVTLKATFAKMVPDGQGLNLWQEQFILSQVKA